MLLHRTFFCGIAAVGYTKIPKKQRGHTEGNQKCPERNCSRNVCGLRNSSKILYSHKLHCRYKRVGITV